MVTSAANRGGGSWPGDVLVSDLEEADLPAASVVRSARIATIEAVHAKPIGRLPTRDRVPVAGAFRSTVGSALALPSGC